MTPSDIAFPPRLSTPTSHPVANVRELCVRIAFSGRRLCSPHPPAAFPVVVSESPPGRVDHLLVPCISDIPRAARDRRWRAGVHAAGFACAASLLGLSLAGCGDLFGPSKLTIAVANKTYNTFQNSHVYFKESSFRSGMILPGDRRDFTEYLGVASGEATVEWELATGTRRTMKVMLDRTYDRKTRGTLLFEVYPDSVAMSFAAGER